MLVDTDELRTLEEVAAFVAGHAAADIARPSRKAAYAHIGTVLARFACWKQGRAAKGLPRRCLLLVTGLSESQLTRPIARYLQEGVVEDRRRGPRCGWRLRISGVSGDGRENSSLGKTSRKHSGRLYGPPDCALRACGKSKLAPSALQFPLRGRKPTIALSASCSDRKLAVLTTLNGGPLWSCQATSSCKLPSRDAVTPLGGTHTLPGRERLEDDVDVLCPVV